MNWLNSLKQSFALDRGRKPGATDGGAQISTSDNQEICAVDHLLRSSRPGVNVPTDLHQSIMRSVRRSSQKCLLPAARSGGLGRWILPAAACLLLVCALPLFHFLLPRPAPRSPAESLQHQLAGLPNAMISPLSTEMESLQKDFHNTTAFLLASIPEVDGATQPR